MRTSAALKLNVPAIRVAVRLVMITVPAVPFSGVVHEAEPSMYVARPPKLVEFTPSGYVPVAAMLYRLSRMVVAVVPDRRVPVMV